MLESYGRIDNISDNVPIVNPKSEIINPINLPWWNVICIFIVVIFNIELTSLTHIQTDYLYEIHTFLFCLDFILSSGLKGANHATLELIRMRRPPAESSDSSSSSFIRANSSPPWAYLAPLRAPGTSRNRFTSCREVFMLYL